MNLNLTCSFRAWTQGGWCSSSYIRLPAFHDSANFRWCRALYWLLCVNVLYTASPPGEASWLACQHISRWFWPTVRCGEGRRQRWWQCHVGESFRSLWPPRWPSVCCHLQRKATATVFTLVLWLAATIELIIPLRPRLLEVVIMECKRDNEMQTWLLCFLCCFCASRRNFTATKQRLVKIKGSPFNDQSTWKWLNSSPLFCSVLLLLLVAIYRLCLITVQTNGEKTALCNYSEQSNFLITVNSLETKACINKKHITCI